MVKLFPNINTTLKKSVIKSTSRSPLSRPVSEWRVIALACANTCQYLFKRAIVAHAKLYMKNEVT